MPSSNVSDVERRQIGDNASVTRQGNPVKDVQRFFRNNIHEANRIAKQKLEAALRDYLSTGVEGQSYHPEYAARKNRDPRSERGPYSSSGPVDFNYSGRLWDELVGRGRAKPSNNTIQVWVGLKNRAKSRPDSAPGTFSTYGKLVDHLQRAKPARSGNPNPFKVSEEQMDRIANETMRELLSGFA